MKVKVDQNYKRDFDSYSESADAASVQGSSSYGSGSRSSGRTVLKKIGVDHETERGWKTDGTYSLNGPTSALYSGKEGACVVP